jgi:UDP-MurNAc hydroxylase
VPSAGPPCFLDEELFHLNVITGEESSIFVDQRPFLQRLSAAGRRGELAIPGTAFDVQPGAVTAAHPLDDADVAAIFDDKGAYLRRYQADWAGWLADERASWAQDTTDLLAALQAWFEPLMKMAPTVCAGISDTVVLHAGDESIALDFVAKTVGPYTDQPHSFWFRIDRHLVETVVAAKAVDWSNALFLSCRFTAWRSGAYNEFVYNFFKSLSLERMRRTEAEALRRLEPDRSAMAAEDVRIGDFWVQRTCPHRQADLGVFGEVDGEHLVCTLHGWRFDLHTGECLTAAEHPIRVRRATD